MDVSLIRSMLYRIYENHQRDGLTSEQAKLALKRMEPFNEYEDLIDELI